MVAGAGIQRTDGGSGCLVPGDTRDMIDRFILSVHGTEGPADASPRDSWCRTIRVVVAYRQRIGHRHVTPVVENAHMLRSSVDESRRMPTRLTQWGDARNFVAVGNLGEQITARLLSSLGYQLLGAGGYPITITSNNTKSFPPSQSSRLSPKGTQGVCGSQPSTRKAARSTAGSW